MLSLSSPPPREPHARRPGLEGDGTFFHRLPTVNMMPPAGQACKNSTCHWPVVRAVAVVRRAHAVEADRQHL